MDRSGAVVPIEDRINYCFTRSLAGSKLPSDSREMQDIVAYLAFISKGVPTGEHVRGEGCRRCPSSIGDSSRGTQAVHRQLRALSWQRRRRHGTRSPRCGARSRSASARRWRAGARGVVHSPQHAVRSSRARSPISRRTTSPPTSRRCRGPTRRARRPIGPSGGAPSDVPYDTKGHKAFRPPKVLPRTTNAAARDRRRAGVRAPTQVITTRLMTRHDRSPAAR